MSTSIFHKVGTVALVAVMAVPFAANAESTFVTGAGAQSTNARVDFQITIPRFVSLRVGSAAADDQPGHLRAYSSTDGGRRYGRGRRW